MAKGVREREFQNRLIEWSLPLGWEYTAGRSLPREHTQTVVEAHLRDAVVRLNKDVIDGFDVDAVVGDVVATVNTVEGGLVAANERVLRLLRGRKEFRNADGEWVPLRFVDFDDPTANTLVVSDEVTISVPGKTSRRFDVVYWVNGLPLVVVEVKSPTADSSWVDAAREINDVYATEYPWFFTPNVFAVASDGLKFRYGAALAPTNLWQPFRSTADDENLGGMADVQRSAELLLHPVNVLDLLANFCLFDTSGGGVDIKYLPRYPQKEAAHLIHQRVVAGGDRGLVWHHQGSGKTLLMVFATSLLLNDTRSESPTVVLISDRTDLVSQTSKVFVSALGRDFFHEPASGAALRDLFASDTRGVIVTTVHKFADAGSALTTRSNVVVMIDEAHRTQSKDDESLAGQMRAALPNAKFFGMTGTPVRNLNTDTFALFGHPDDPDGVMHRYSVTRSLLDEATVPVLLEPHPVSFDVADEALQKEFDEFADGRNLDNLDRKTLAQKFGRITSVFANPDRIEAVCQNIVDHYFDHIYANGMKAQVVTYNREMAVAYTDKINEILSGFEVKQRLAAIGRHDALSAEVNISVSDSKDEDPALRAYAMTTPEEDAQKRRFLAPEHPLSFLVVTAKLMTGFDAPNEGALYLDKPIKAHNLFQTITRPNRTWVSPTGYVKTQGVVVDYIGLAEEVQKAVMDPTGGSDKPFVVDMTELVKEFRDTFTRIEDRLAPVNINVNDYSTVRAVSDALAADTDITDAFKKDYRLLAKVYPYVEGDPRVKKFEEPFALLGSVYTLLFKASSDEERKARLAELGPQVLAIINRHVSKFEAAKSHEDALMLDAQGLRILRELLTVIPDPNAPDAPEPKQPPSAAQILERIKKALEKGVPEESAKYAALAERIKALREAVIQNADDALKFLAKALQIARDIVDAQKAPNEVVIVDDDHIGVLSRIIAEHAPQGLSLAEKRIAEKVDEVVRRTMTMQWDNADARNRGVRRAAAAVFREASLKPVGEPYDSTVAYIEAHYLVD